MKNEKKICLPCEKMNGREYKLLKHEDGYFYCGHCGKVSGRLNAWKTKEEKEKE